MAQFPLKEAEILVLAQQMVAGLTANPTVFPAPPIPPSGPAIPPTNLSMRISDYTAARDDALAAQAAAEQATMTKDSALGELVDGMKSDLRYAENVTGFNDTQLKLIGWSGKKARTDLLPPGQCRTLEAPRQGEGWVFLDWKEPIDGGKPAAYKIQRRERPAGNWEDVSTAMDSEATLVDQPRGKDLEYRAIAVNKAGDGEASNTILAVL